MGVTHRDIIEEGYHPNPDMCRFQMPHAITIEDPFLIPFTDSILEEVAGHEIYSFMDGFLGYNQICIAEEDKLKMKFVVVEGCSHTTECHSTYAMHRLHSKESYCTYLTKCLSGVSKHS